MGEPSVSQWRVDPRPQWPRPDAGVNRGIPIPIRPSSFSGGRRRRTLDAPGNCAAVLRFPRVRPAAAFLPRRRLGHHLPPRFLLILGSSRRRRHRPRETPTGHCNPRRLPPARPHLLPLSVGVRNERDLRLVVFLRPQQRRQRRHAEHHHARTDDRFSDGPIGRRRDGLFCTTFIGIVTIISSSTVNFSPRPGRGRKEQQQQQQQQQQ